MKGTDAMIELINNAKACGLSADYVLFDTWFSSPSQLLAIKNTGMDAIAMIKKSSRIFYTYAGEKMNIKKLYGMCKKNRGRSKILLSINVQIGNPILGVGSFSYLYPALIVPSVPPYM